MKIVIVKKVDKVFNRNLVLYLVVSRLFATSLKIITSSSRLAKGFFLLKKIKFIKVQRTQRTRSKTYKQYILESKHEISLTPNIRRHLC